MRMKSSLIIILVALLVAPASTLLAGDLYWSGDGSSQGGSGTWDTSNTRWGAGSGGPFSALWNNSNNDDAFFGSTAGTVSLGTDIQVGNLLFNTTGYTIGGSYVLNVGTGSAFTNNIGLVTFASGLVVTNMGAITVGIKASDKQLAVSGATVYATVLNVGNCKSGESSRNVVTVDNGTINIAGAIPNAIRST